jgi:tetratricopeptide (TPR) repeat protein
MADSSRVEELRKRYHENPRRFFAPLANEYRKGGFLDRAILLCQKHLGEQPGNMNGLIVYGQTLFESGRHEEARGPFEAALEVDPENLIALRHLGDIARLSGDNAAAKRWYGRVLEYDRRNDEVRELLEQVGGPDEAGSGETARSAAAAPSAPPSMAGTSGTATLELLGNDLSLDEPAPAPSLAAAKTLEVTPRRPVTPSPNEIQSRPSTSPKTLEITPRRAPTPPRPAAPAKGMRRASLLDINFDFGEISGAPETVTAPPPAAPVLDSEAAEYGFAATDDLPLLDPGVDDGHEPLLSGATNASLIDLPPESVSMGEVAPVAGLEAAEYDADVPPLDDLEPATFDAGHDQVAPLAELETAEFEVPAADEPFGAMSGIDGLEMDREFEVPSAGLDEPEFEVPTAEPPAGGLVFLEETIEAASTEPAILTPESLPIIESGSVGHRNATPASQPAIVTETMAELYLEQGHRAEAIEVYRQLIAQDPSDTALKAKLAGLEAPEPARQSIEFDVPADAVEDAGRAPANAMLSEVSFADLDLSTPVAAALPVAAAAPAVPVASAAPAPPRPSAPVRATPSGPSARQFLSGFVNRTLARETSVSRGVVTPPSGSWAVPAAISSLDDLFGVEVTDEDQRAANYLAGVGTTSAPSGSSSFDALFAAKESAPPARNSVPRASEKLKFDQFFSSSSTPAATPVPELPPAPEPPTGASGDDDDLDQFQGWLKGLTQ